MSRVRLLKQVQVLPIPVEEAWRFFAHPKNLAVITPERLNLKFTNDVYGDSLYTGQIITYKIKPLLGIPLFWMTEITHVEPLRFFVDEQRRGPYALWHHQHHFKPVASGTEMTDIIHYQLPFGVLGNLALPMVKKQLAYIFNYRQQKIKKLFGE